MAETLDPPQTDDAPLTSARKEAAAIDVATDGLIEPSGDTLVGRAVTINRPAAELFTFWRDFSNLAAFMENLERIDILDAKRSHWVVKGPGGKSYEWTSQVTEEAEGRFIAWASEEGADVANSGRVDFRDAGGRGTVVTATILYDAPGGVIGRTIAKLFQREPKIQAQRDLRRFKQLMETGEIATAARTRKQLEEERN